MNFFGTEYSSVYVNNNGNVTFSEPLPQYTPSDLTTFGSPIIAPFFADVDTRGTDSALVNFGTGTLNGQKVFVVNWPGVGCFDEVSNVLDNFQMILIDRPDLGTSALGDDFDMEFNYNTIQWDTGQASGGDTNCQNSAESGTSAYVGYGNGTTTAGDSYNLPGSGVANTFLDSSTTTGLIYNDLNSTTLGRYIFAVENGQPTQPTTLATSLSGDAQSGSAISVPESTAVTDTATLSGSSASTATGTVTYNVYSDSGCTGTPVSAGTPETITTPGSLPASSPVTLSSPGTYYWQAVYSGDSTNNGSNSTCGTSGEVETVTGTPPASTTLATSLSGGDQSGTTISVAENTSVSDQASLSGSNASTATGTVTYSVYSDSLCSVPVSTGAAETIATPGTMPDSSPVSVANAGTYYWQASYSGDSSNAPSVSACGTAASGGEVETVTAPPAMTTITTSLSGGGQSGTAISVPEITNVTDTATLSGTNAATATGTVTYDVYSNSSCTDVSSLGAAQDITTPGTLPASVVQDFNINGTYYWQASYSGDANNAPSMSTCGTVASGGEVETVLLPPPTSLTTSLSGGGQSGMDISVPPNTEVIDTATVIGTSGSTATGNIFYYVYSDPACTMLVETVGIPDMITPSPPVTLSNPGTYYWKASYSGDPDNGPSVSTCGTDGEVETVTTTTTAAPTSITTLLSTGGNSTGGCGEPPSWNDAGSAGCGDLGDGGRGVCNGSTGGNGPGWGGCGHAYGAPSIMVPTGTAVTDSAALSGANASTATGTVTYNVYSDPACTMAVNSGSQEPITPAGEVPDSTPVTLSTPGTYYWQASYSGDSANAPSISTCGSEVETVTPAPTKLTTTLLGSGTFGGGRCLWWGDILSVFSGAAVTDSATLSGPDAATAGGTVTYTVYTFTGNWQKTPVASGGTFPVTDGSVPNSDPVNLPIGLYIWQASYSGDANNAPSISPWGSEIEIVTPVPQCQYGWHWGFNGGCRSQSSGKQG